MASSSAFDLNGALARLPRVRLVEWATPVQPLDRLRDALGGAGKGVPRLLIKRDDLNGIALGGNKLRKLEWLLADALDRGADVLLTAGAAQSNHCRQTAAVGVMYGVETHLCLRGPAPERSTGNLVLDDWLGARLHFAPEGEDVSAFMAAHAARLEGEGRKPYVIPIGGSNAIGSVGFAAAVGELAGQGVVPDVIVAATGSGGTQAGLEVGVRLLWPEQARVHGIGVALPDTTSWQADVATLANAVAARLGADLIVSPADVTCPMDYMGAKYGVPTAESDAAIRLLARTEGIFLDPVYSAKAFAGLLDRIARGIYHPDQTVLFWHTGGTPALFA